MREKLKQANGNRSIFEGIFERFGIKNSFGHPKHTLLLKDIKDNSGKVVTDHLWFNVGKRFDSLKLQAGDIVRFDARVKPYVKGYRGYREDVYDSPVETDYKLSNPTNLRKVTKEVPQLSMLGESVLCQKI